MTGQGGSGIWPAAREAADLVEPGMVVGLGTGRAASMFVRALAQRVGAGLDVRGVPTSEAIAELARGLSIPLVSLNDVEEVHIDVDGADEVSPSLDLIKGHGGALRDSREMPGSNTFSRDLRRDRQRGSC